jgi:hypothetical protein
MTRALKDPQEMEILRALLDKASNFSENLLHPNPFRCNIPGVFSKPGNGASSTIIQDTYPFSGGMFYEA